jgi:hypothetical protein
VNPLTGARAVIAAALAQSSDLAGVPVHDFPPATIAGACVVLWPGEPWLVPRGHVTIDVTAYAATAAGNSNALSRLEDLVTGIRSALFAAALSAGDVSAPRYVAEAGHVHATIPVRIRTSCN